MQTSHRARQHKRDVMYENNMDATQFVTLEEVAVNSRVGNTITKRVKVAVNLEESDLANIPVVGTSHPTNDHIFESLVDGANHVPVVASKPQKVKP